MNPEDNNPLNTTGTSGMDGALGSFNPNDTSAAGAMPGATSPDLAIPGSDNIMASSNNLASVENNLNTMDMASNSFSPTNDLMGQGQPAGADTAAPEFTAPDMPLTPAAPVPGSIGSAVSAPANASLPVADNAPEPAAQNANLMTSVTDMGSLPPMNAASNGLGSTPDINHEQNPNAHYNPFTQSTASTSNNSGQNFGANNIPNAASNTPAGAPAAQPAFQPISPAQAVAPSTAVAQKAKAHSKLNLLLAIALVVTATVAIIFVVLYINALNNTKTVPVAPITDGNVVQTPVKEVTCELNREDGGNEVLTLNYLGDNLSQISITQNTSYESEEAALAQRDILEAQRAANLNIAGLTEEPYDVSYVADGNNVTATITATADKLRPEDADLLMLTTVDGTLDTSEAAIRSNYESRGFVCSE